MLLAVRWFVAATRYSTFYYFPFLEFSFHFWQAGEYYIENVLRQKSANLPQSQALTPGLSDATSGTCGSNYS